MEIESTVVNGTEKYIEILYKNLMIFSDFIFIIFIFIFFRTEVKRRISM